MVKQITSQKAQTVPWSAVNKQVIKVRKYSLQKCSIALYCITLVFLFSCSVCFVVVFVYFVNAAIAQKQSKGDAERRKGDKETQGEY